MKIDENEFFRNATLKICGNLEIHKAMKSSFDYISSFIPLDVMYMQVIEPNLNSLRIIAKATKEESKEMDLLVSISDKFFINVKRVNSIIEDRKDNLLWIVNNSEEEPFTKSIIKSLNEKPSSLMGMLLIIKDKPIGSLICLAKGKNRFNDEHMKLLSLLREPFYIALSNALSHREIIMLKDILIDDNRYLQESLMLKSGDNIIGSNFGLKNVMELVRKVAVKDSPVMLLGETGTGKDLIANAIHYSSSRRDGPFISVNCGAIPESLIDSELFGHEKGAFTGALFQKRGRFERANKGTIFLDEVGELPLHAQVRLLRVIQNREIERVGGTKTIELDIRIIAATNRNLEDMVKNKVFREDLWFRLNVFPINIPPLRERKADIPALLQHFLLQKTRELKLNSIPEIESNSIKLLTEYTWPGNVRELENVVERALILNKEGTLSFKNLLQNDKQEFIDDKKDTDNVLILDEVIKNHILRVLSKTKGKIHGPDGAAEILGINASTLRNRMNKLNINYGRNTNY